MATHPCKPPHPAVLEGAGTTIITTTILAREAAVVAAVKAIIINSIPVWDVEVAAVVEDGASEAVAIMLECGSRLPEGGCQIIMHLLLLLLLPQWPSIQAA